MKSLKLVLKGKWFDMIASGEKKEEYREITPYWIKRLLDEVTENLIDAELFWDNHLYKHKPFKTVTFYHGYAKDRATMELPIKEIEIDTGNPKWGAEADKLYFVIRLGGKRCLTQ